MAARAKGSQEITDLTMAMVQHYHEEVNARAEIQAMSVMLAITSLLASMVITIHPGIADQTVAENLCVAMQDALAIRRSGLIPK